MITSKDYYAIMGGNDYANSAFTVNPKTRAVEVNPSGLSNPSGTAVRSPEGDIYSAERLKWIQENDQLYNHQLANIIKKDSPFFQDAYESSMLGTGTRMIAGFWEGVANFAGNTALSVAGTPAVIDRNLEEISWEEYRKNMAPEHTYKLFNVVQGMGGAKNFGMFENADNALSAYEKRTETKLTEQDKKDLREYHKLLQKRMTDEHLMDIYSNYNYAFQGKLSDNFSPSINSSFQQLSKPVGNVVGSLMTNMFLSRVPFVGVTAAYGLAFSNQFYAKRIQALEKGWDLDRANAWATTYATSEALLETLSIKGVTRAALTSSKSIRNAVFNFILPEGLEEASQSLAEGVFDRINGLDPKSASEILIDVGASFVLGTLGGSIVGGIDWTNGQISSRLEALQREEQELKNIALAAGIADANKIETNSARQKLLNTLKEASKIKGKNESMPSLPESELDTSMQPLGQNAEESAAAMDSLDTTPDAQLQKIGEDKAYLSEAQKEYQRKKEELYAKLDQVVRAAAKKKNPNITEKQLDKFVSVAFALVQNPNFHNSIVATMYNTVDNLVKRSNWQNEIAQENIYALGEMYGATYESEEQRKQLGEALKKMLSPEEYQKFEKALIETSLLLRQDFMSLGATEEQAEFLANFYETMFFETALKGGQTPQEIYNAIKPTLLNLTRARLNNQFELVESLLDNIVKAKNDTPLSVSRKNAVDAILSLERCVMNKKGPNKRKADLILFGTDQGTPSAKSILNSLANRALAEQRIHEDMGVLDNLTSEEWLVFALLKEQGYSETELIEEFGGSSLVASDELGVLAKPNYETMYNDSLQKLYPALNQEEIKTLDNIKKNLLRGKKNVEKGGVYSTEDNAILIGADAPISTRLEEVSHFILYKALMDAKKRLDMGVNFNSAADRLVTRINNLAKKRFGAFPDERQFQETVADILHNYYANRRMNDSETSRAVFDAIRESEFNAIKSADSLYNDFTETDKKALDEFAGDLLSDNKYRGYKSQLEAARQLDEASLQMRPDTLKQTLLGIVEDQVNPLAGAGELAFELRNIDENAPEAEFLLQDIAMRTCTALRETAAHQFMAEQQKLANKKNKNPLKEGQLDVFKGFFADAEFKDTSSLNKEYFSLNEREALSPKNLHQSLMNLDYKYTFLGLKDWLSRQTMSAYHFARKFDPVIGRYAREAMSKAGRRKQRDYKIVSDFQKLMREGMKKAGINNTKYWEEFVYNYIQPTKSHHDAAEMFVMKVAGQKGVDAFKKVDEMFDNYKTLLVEAGVHIGLIDIYVPRKIRNFREFMEFLDKDPKHPLTKMISELRKKGATEEEINDAVNALFYAKQKWEGNLVTSTQKRQVYLVKKKDLHYYEDPFDAMISYIDDTNTTLVMRELFGYSQDPFGKNPDFDLIKKNVKEEYLFHEAYNSVLPLEKEIETLDTEEQMHSFIKNKAGMTVDAFAKKYSGGKKSYDALGLALYDKWLSEKIKEAESKQGVKNAAEDKANAFFEVFKRKLSDSSQRYGKVGVVLKRYAENKTKSSDEIKALHESLASLGRRIGGNVKALDTIRAINTLVVIGSKITSGITNLQELAITASRFGLFNTLKAFSQATREHNKNLMKELGLPELDEAFTTQTDNVVARTTDFALDAIGFKWFDRVTKTTSALAALEHASKVLKKGDVNSEEYKALQDQLDRYFAYDPSLDLKENMKHRREQVEQDLKDGKVTSDTNFFMFNVISDQQPINVLEVPIGYNMYGSVGKLCYQFSTVQLKQLETISDDIYEAYKRGGPAEAAKKFMKYVFFAALFGVPTEWLKSLLKLQRPEPLPETALFAITQYVFITKYSWAMMKKGDPISAVIDQFTPQATLFSDIWKSFTRNVFGDAPLKDARIFKDIPVIGELIWFYIGGGRSYLQDNDLYLLENAEIDDSIESGIKFLGGF